MTPSSKYQNNSVWKSCFENMAEEKNRLIQLFRRRHTWLGCVVYIVNSFHPTYPTHRLGWHCEAEARAMMAEDGPNNPGMDLKLEWLEQVEILYIWWRGCVLNRTRSLLFNKLFLGVGHKISRKQGHCFYACSKSMLIFFIFAQVRVNLPAVKRRVESLSGRRTVKQQWQVHKYYCKYQ